MATALLNRFIITLCSATLCSATLSLGCSLVIDVDELQQGENLVVECTADGECDDQIDCTLDSCNAAGECQYEPDDSRCDRLFICDTDTGCVSSGKECETDTECDDDIDCTDDLCQLWTCYNRPLHQLCVTGDPCILEEQCIRETGCTSGIPKTCEQPDQEVYPCKRAVCDSADGSCVMDDSIGADDDSDSFLDGLCGGDDCDDLATAVNPAAIEICDDGIDNNCDGFTDTGAGC